MDLPGRIRVRPREEARVRRPEGPAVVASPPAPAALRVPAGADALEAIRSEPDYDNRPFDVRVVESLADIVLLQARCGAGPNRATPVDTCSLTQRVIIGVNLEG